MESASKKNEPNGLTGMLIYCEGNFVQVLEGEPEVVEAIYARILNDLRHKEIIEVSHQSIDQRSLGHWSMGFRAIDLAELLMCRPMRHFLMAVFQQPVSAHNPACR